MKSKAHPPAKSVVVEPPLPYSLAILLYDSGAGPSDVPRVALAALSYRSHTAPATARFKSGHTFLHSWRSDHPSHAALLDALYTPIDSEHAPHPEAVAVGSEQASLLSLRRAFRLFERRNNSATGGETGLVLLSRLDLLWRANMALPATLPTLPGSLRGRAWLPGRCECAQPPHASNWWGVGFPLALSPDLVRGLVSSSRLDALIATGTTPRSRADAVLRCLVDELHVEVEALPIQAGIDFTTVAHSGWTPPSGCVRSRGVAVPVPRAAARPLGLTPSAIEAAAENDVKSSLRETRAKRLLRTLTPSQAAARRRALQWTDRSSCVSHVNSNVRRGGVRDHLAFQQVCLRTERGLLGCSCDSCSCSSYGVHYFWQHLVQLVARALDPRSALEPAQGYDYRAIPHPGQLRNTSDIATWLLTLWDQPCLVIRYSGCERSHIKQELLHKRNAAIGRRQLSKQRRRRRMEAQG